MTNEHGAKGAGESELRCIDLLKQQTEAPTTAGAQAYDRGMFTNELNQELLFWLCWKMAFVG